MVESSAPSPDRIEELLVPVLELPDAERTAALEDLCSTNPELSESLRARFALFERMLATVPDEGDGPRTFGEFELIRELGRGGMGVVYLAKQRRGTTERMVALKLVQDRGLFSSQARERFRREAEATFRLDHPVFCPVLDVGEVIGTPYLAMRFVPGVTLAKLIERARREGQNLELPRQQGVTDDTSEQSESAGSGDRSSRILHLIEKVARALHVAHEAGLVHRDVKPGNIMVTLEGAPVLLDFGLVRDDSEDDLKLTLTGQPIGTPAYMSPEQVSPKGRQLDRTTDVYSLGATLYEALTLQTPFQARTREDLYRAVLTENPSDPRQLSAGISKDLKVVLDTALNKEPDRRYATAHAFADDLRRVRLHQPILARPTGIARRLRLWSVRNRLASAILALLLISQVAILVLASASRRNAEEAVRERTRALQHLGSARTAITEMVNNARVHMADVPWLESARQDLYEKALAFNTELLESESDDPALRLDAVEIRRDTASWLIDMGRVGEAEVLLAEANDILEGLQTDKILEVHAQRARIENLEAVAARERGDTPAHVTNLESAVDSFRTALRTSVVEDNDYLAHAEALTTLAALKREMDQRDDARALLQEAQTVLDNVRSRGLQGLHRARVFGESARLFRDARDYDSADGEFEAAATLLRAWLQTREYDRDIMARLGTNRISHGLLHSQQRKSKEAQEAYEEAVEIFDQLARTFPAITNYQANLATVLSNLSNVKRRAQDPEGARALLKRSVEVIERVVESSSRAGYRDQLVRSYLSLARLLEDSSLEAALPYYRKAVEAVEVLIREQPNVARYLDMASDSHLGVGSTLADLGRQDEAKASMTRAVEYAERVKNLQPDNPNYRSTYALVLYNEGWRLSNGGEPEAGAERMREAISERRWLVDNYGHDVRVVPDLLDAWVRLGWIGERLEHSADIWLEAEAALGDLVEKNRQALEEVPRSRFNLGCYWAGMARAKANAGNTSDSHEALAQSLSLLNVADGNYPIAELVRCFALRARLHEAAGLSEDAATAARQAAEYAALFDPEGVDGPARLRLLPSLTELQTMLPEDTSAEHIKAVADLLQRLPNG